MTEAMERRRLGQTEPVDELSRSLYEFEKQMAELDEIGIAALAAETDADGRQILTLEEAGRMADHCRQEAASRRVSDFWG